MVIVNIETNFETDFETLLANYCLNSYTSKLLISYTSTLL